MAKASSFFPASHDSSYSICTPFCQMDGREILRRFRFGCTLPRCLISSGSIFWYENSISSKRGHLDANLLNFWVQRYQQLVNCMLFNELALQSEAQKGT